MNIFKMSNEEIYLEYYSKLPKFLAAFIAGLIAIGGSLEVLIASRFTRRDYEGVWTFIVGDDGWLSAILAVLIWCAIAALFFFLMYLILRISFSRNMLIVERLTQIRDKE